MVWQTDSADQTQQIASNLAKQILTGTTDRAIAIALFGPIGAGKTTFAQGFAQGLGIKDKVISPTFVLMRQHPLPDSKKILYHLDLYRLTTEQSLSELGLNELLDDPNNIILIEWAEKIEGSLPDQTKKINFEIISLLSRRLTLTE